MDLQAIMTFTLMVMLLTIMPGPNTALILKTVPQSGRRAGLFNLAGIVTGFFLQGLFSILGLSALILHTAQLFLAVKLLGACYLIYLGVTTLWKAFLSKRASPEAIMPGRGKPAARRTGRLFAEGVLTTILNPKASLFYLAVFPQFISLNGNPVFESLALVVIHVCVVTVWFVFMIVALGKISRAMSSGRFKKAVAGLTGSLMLWFGYRLLTFEQRG